MRQKGSLWFHPVSLCGYSAHNYSVIAKCGCFPGTTSMCSSATFYNKCSLCNHDCNQNTHCAIPSNVSLCCAFIVTPFHPAPPSSTPANTNLLSIYIILSFWECCVNGNIWYMTFQTDSFYSAQCSWRRVSTEEPILSNYGAGEDSCKSLALERDQASQS